MPTNWSNTGSTCVSSLGDPPTTAANIDLDPAETITCTFTNQLQTGNIIVDKVTVPATGEDPNFDFTASWLTANAATSPDFSLDDNDTPFDSGPLNAGTYSVAEINIPTGWTKTGDTCVSDAGDPATSAAAIDLDSNETITCTFKNTKDASLIVRKTSVGGTGEFDFAGTGTGVTADFDITTLVAGTPVAYPTFEFDGDPTSEFGLKEVGETPETGYDLTDISCSGDTTGLVIGRYDGLTFVNGGGNGFDVGDTHFRVDIGAGENVTCTFDQHQGRQPHRPQDLRRWRRRVRLRGHGHGRHRGLRHHDPRGRHPGRLPDLRVRRRRLRVRPQGGRRDARDGLRPDRHQLLR